MKRAFRAVWLLRGIFYFWLGFQIANVLCDDGLLRFMLGLLLSVGIAVVVELSPERFLLK